MTIEDKAIRILRDAARPECHYCVMQREIEHRWPGTFEGLTPERSLNRSLHNLRRQGVVRTPRLGSGIFYLSAREGER